LPITATVGRADKMRPSTIKRTFCNRARTSTVAGKERKEPGA
jgi:hypothetical protein